MERQMERVNVTEQVVAYIREHIESGAWPIGSKIPSENQMTETLGVSRASVRAAIRHFVGLGVLESFHGKGTFVQRAQMEAEARSSLHFTAEDLKDMKKVLEFRWMLEPEACFLAAEKATPALLQRLEEMTERLVKSIEDPAAFIQADMDFHMEICRGCENPIVVKSMQMLYQENRDVFDRIHAKFGYKDGVYYHTLILQAMKAGDASAAKEMMQEHLKQAFDRAELI